MRIRIQSGTADNGGTRVDIESQSERLAILGGVDLFPPGGARVEHIDHLEDRKAVSRGPFVITPFIGHPPACDASAILVEADGAALFYVGDLRAGAVQKLLQAPTPRVDVLLIEGATIGKARSSDGYPTEGDFEERFVTLFQTARGMPLVWCSEQNVDRLLTIYRACLRTNRQFIVDAPTADALRSARATGPAASAWAHVSMFRPTPQRRTSRAGAAAAQKATDGPPGIALEELAPAAGRSVMVFRPDLMPDLERAKCLAGATLIFAMWSGYLEYEKANPVLEWLDRHGIPLEQCYAAGHAGTMDLIKLREAFPTAAVVPIHAQEAERLEEMFGRVQRQDDGAWWPVPLL